jgi:uncharacterized protein (TIGR03437 family)
MNFNAVVGLTLSWALLAFGQSGPEIFPRGVVNAANYGPLIAPGSVISIFGTGLGQTQYLQTLPYPTQMGETSVAVNGEPAPLLFVSPTLVNALVPADIPVGPASVVVTVGNPSSNPANIIVKPVAPALFTTHATGRGNVVAQHLDYSVVTRSSPAQPGEVIVVYGTGLGQVDMNGVSETPEVTLAGRTAKVIYAGQTIYPGLYQINLQVPNIVVGDQEIVIRMPRERFSSSDGVTVPIFGRPLSGTEIAVAPEFFGLHMTPETINGKTGVPWPPFGFGPVRLHDTVTKWADIDKGGGVYDFTKLDNLLSNLAEQGKTDLIFTMWGTPEYAAGGRTCENASGVTFTCVPPSDLNSDGTGPNQYWKNYITALANHAAGQIPGKIEYWEIWNEPNYSNYWTGTVEQLVTMARDAYTIIKQVDPQALIFTPPVARGAHTDSGGGWSWLDRYFKAGGDQWTDIVVFHGYPNPQVRPVSPESVLDGIARIVSISPPGKRIWNGESSWGRNTTLPDPDMQAAFAARSQLVQMGVVDRYYWYQYPSPEWGTITDSNHELTPAGIALGEVYNWTVGSTFAAPCAPLTPSGTTWSCQLTRPGGYLAEIVWDTSEECSGGTCPTIDFMPSPGMISYRDLAGNVYPIHAGSPVPISAKPILLSNEWDTASTVVLSPASLSFGAHVYLEPSESQTVTLTNSATTSLNITSISVTGVNSGDFTQTNTCGSRVESNGSCTITVTFTPTGIGERIASITVADDAAGSPQTVPLSGTGLTAITVSPASLTFPTTNVGTTAMAQKVTVTNGGSAPIAMKGFTFSGPNTSDFQQTNTCGSSLAAGGGCDISVTFTPAAGGTRSATLSIAHGDPASPLTLPVSGTGSSEPAVALSPASLTFGSVAYLKASTPQAVTLTNTGGAALNITSVAVTSTNANDFTQTSDCGSLVPAGETCTFTVTFTPHWTGPRTASLKITDSASGSPHLVSLMGTGIVEFNLSPASLTFSPVEVGTAAAAQTVTVTNPTAAGTSIGITITGTNGGDFTQTNSCKTSLSAGASCTINVTFTASAAGTRSANLSISDGDPAKPQMVALSGTGTSEPTVVLSPLSLTFGNVVYLAASTPETVTLSNSGSGVLNLASVAVIGANANDFAQTNNCGTSVAAGASCALTVTFTPLWTGTRTASLSITTNASGSPHSVSLTGTGVAAISASPASIAFPAGPVGSKSPPLNVTLANASSAVITISSVTVTGANSSDFVVTNNCGASLSGAGSCTLGVSFTPTAQGTRTASITISDSDPTSPQIISLSGTGK